MVLVSSHRFTEHVTPPGHPERIERAEVCNEVAAAFRREGGEVREPRLATREELARVHTAEYLDLIASTGGGRPTMARAGGKDAGKVPEARAAARKWVAENLSGL